MKSFFYYGTMNSSKSAQLLMAGHNYESSGKDVIYIKPALDTRSERITSRIGAEHEADYIISDDCFDRANSLCDIVLDSLTVSAIFIDEAQFLPPSFIRELLSRLEDTNVSILFYGLLKDFRGHIFDASQALLEEVDDIREIKTVCHYCDDKATFNLRTVDGQPVYTGEQLKIGDTDYLSVCRRHYYYPAI